MVRIKNLGASKDIQTSISQSKTKPLKESKIRSLQKKQKIQKKVEKVKTIGRQKPISKIETEYKYSLWLIPARVAFFLNGLYFLAFSIISFIGLFSDFKIIKPFFTLPFDTNFSSFFLLEIAAMFSFLVSLMFFHAARQPRLYKWFYFLMILLVLPYHFVSNIQKLQIDLPLDFQNYLFFDTIIMTILWGAYLLSIYSFFKLNNHNNS